MRKPSSRFDSSALRRKRNDDYFDDLSLSFFSSSESSFLKSGLTKSASSSFLSLSLSLGWLVFQQSLRVLKKMKQIIEKKKEKNSKKILSLHSCLFSFVRCLAQIQSNHRLISFEFSLSLLFSLEQQPLYHKGSEGVLFCSAKSFVTVFAKLFFHETTRESEIYITHRRRSTNVATTDDERTISKSKVGTVLRAL